MFTECHMIHFTCTVLSQKIEGHSAQTAECVVSFDIEEYQSTTVYNPVYN